MNYSLLLSTALLASPWFSPPLCPDSGASRWPAFEGTHERLPDPSEEVRTEPDPEWSGASALALVAAQPNLIVTGISHRAFMQPDNTCSVIFLVSVKNIGTATAWSLSVGAKGWGVPTVQTCTGIWRAFNTTANIAPGQARTVSVAGPGYVGPRVHRGTTLNITGFADLHCSVAESSESDNSRTTTIRVGL